ncbi:MAG: YfhO family protein [Prevotellaceae bacterium]|nr:YfhO family protein [Prevotellaceae bacterium]
MKDISLKAYVPYFVAIVIFIVISTGYFMPEIFQNKALYQHDVVTGNSIGREAANFTAETGERTFWINGLFGGMPTYQIAPGGPSSRILGYIQRILSLYVLPSPANIVFILLFGAFLLFIALRINPWLAILGSVAYAFSSYFFIIIEAGHIWKVYTLAYIPPTFAGIIWTYRGKYWSGAIVTAVYMALQLVSNHPQMTYYFGLVVLIYLIGRLIYSYKNKQILRFIKASLMTVVATGIAFALNFTNLYHTMDYSKYSIRGGSELTDNMQDKTDGGLDRSYVTGWSYGIGETFTLLIPNAKGGASGYLAADEKIAREITSKVQNNTRISNQAKNGVAQQIFYANTYWADQPSTSGPVYAGAFMVFLFVLGLFIVRGWFKYVLLISTIMSIMLSWGSNCMWLTNFFLDYFPYYNKLRAVASILVIAELCIPMLAILALKKIIETPSVLKQTIHIKRLKRDISVFHIGLASTAGLILLFIISPSTFFSFFTQQETQSFAEAAKNPQVSVIISQMKDIIESVRISIFRADAWRSLIIICAGATLVLLYSRKKLNLKLFLAALIALTLVDLGAVNKRYLSAEDFKPRKLQKTDLVSKTPVDEEILTDPDLNYRVCNLAVSTFNDGTTSYYHKSIGGYHGAKMRRYQDIIERYLGRINFENVESLLGTKYFDVPNMLNTKYIIMPGQKLLRNPNALGNAWFVDEIKWVANADEEIAALADSNPAKTAVIDKRFETDELRKIEYKVEEQVPDSINNSSIKLLEYKPNKLIYESNADTRKLAVFSEIYYPNGWHAYIDGQEAEIIRANYILRALLIPEGKHTVEFSFNPKSYTVTENIAWTGYVLLLGFVVLSIMAGVRKINRKTEQ